MDRIALLREYLASAIGSMEFNIAQHEKLGGEWPYPGTYEEAKGRLKGYREIHQIVAR